MGEKQQRTKRQIVKELIDLHDVEAVGFQISADGQRVWLCIDGACFLRVKGIRRGVEISDDR